MSGMSGPVRLWFGGIGVIIASWLIMSLAHALDDKPLLVAGVVIGLSGLVLTIGSCVLIVIHTAQRDLD